MGRSLRYIPPGGGVVLITTRTVQGRFLLRPGARFNRLALGVLGRGLERHDVQLHAVSILSNHYHLLMYVSDAREMSRFMSFFNGNLVKEAGRLHRWKDKIWSRRYSATWVSEEPAAQIDRLKYVLAQGCKEGLIASPLDWPGVTSAKALLHGEALEGEWVNRTLEYRAFQEGREPDASETRATVGVPLAPLPCWRELSDERRRRLVADLIDQIERESSERIEREGKPPLGRRAILRQHPHASPQRTSKSPVPRVHCMTKAVRRHFLEAYQIFVIAYREAAERWRQGDRQVDFPHGCFPPPLPFVKPTSVSG